MSSSNNRKSNKSKKVGKTGKTPHMTKSPITYDSDAIKQIQNWVVGVPNISRAYDIIASKLELSRDHVRRLNRKYGFWTPFSDKLAQIDKSRENVLSVLDKKVDKDINKEVRKIEARKNSPFRGMKSDMVFSEEMSLEDDKKTDAKISQKTVDFIKSGIMSSEKWDDSYSDLKGVAIEQNTLNPQSAKVSYDGNNGIAESVDKTIKTLDDLIEACDIDLNIWNISKHIINKYNCGHDPVFQVKVWLEKKVVQEDFKALLEDFKKRAESYIPKKFEYNNSIEPNGRLLEVSVNDIHYARLCWAKEVGTPYNIDIAKENHQNAVKDLVNKARGMGVTKILLPCGGDAFNSDNMKMTTSAGTEQSQNEDSRWQKTFSTVCDSYISIIEELASEFEVDCPIVSGNHDYERCYYLGEVLKKNFKNHPRVNINNDPTQRKYYRFGKNLILFTHGNEEKHDKLPLIMANERPTDWSETSWRFIHLGHFHGAKLTEIQGVMVEVITSLCPPDSWSTSKGYVGGVRGAKAFLYDEQDGMIANYFHSAK